MVVQFKSSGPHKHDGPWAWLVCFSGLLINAVLFGFISGFGIMLPVWCKEFNADRGTTAWIGSLTIGSLFLFSPLTISITGRIGERKVGLFSAVCSAATMVASSFAHKMVILFFTQGFIIGICGSMLMNISLLSVRKYFKKKVALAIGISGSGGSIGTMVFGPVMQALVDFMGWRNSFRVIAALFLVVGILTCFFDGKIEDDNVEVRCNKEKTELLVDKEKKQHERKIRDLTDCSIWNSPKYTIGTVSVWLTFCGLFVPMIHMISLANEKNIPSSKSSLLFTFIGIFSFMAQVAIGRVIDKRWLTSLQSIQLSSYFLGLTLILFAVANSYTWFIVLSVLFGAANGAFVASQTVFFLTCFGNLKKDAAGYGISHMTKSIPLFTGAPIAGTLAEHFHSYVPALFIFGGVVFFSGCLPFLLACFNTEDKARTVTEVEIVAVKETVV